jgi:hypothetical protein
MPFGTLPIAKPLVIIKEKTYGKKFDIINNNIDFLSIHFSFLDIDSWLRQKEIRHKDVETLAI